MRLVKATMANALDFLQFKNDCDTQRFSIIQNGLILWKDHLSWMESRVKKPGFYAVMTGSICVGDLRFDFGDDTEISIRLRREYRSRGLGTRVLEVAVEMHNPLMAKIVVGNNASLNLFSKVGFVPASIEEANGVPYIVMRRG